MAVQEFIRRIQDLLKTDSGISGNAQKIEQIAWMLFLKIYATKEEDWDLEYDDYVSIVPEECKWEAWAVDTKDENGKPDGTALTGDDLLNFVNNTLFPTLKNLEIDESTPINKTILKSAFEDTNNYQKDGILLRQALNIVDEVDFTDNEERHAFGYIYESLLKDLQSSGDSGEYYTPRAVTDFVVQQVKPVLGERVADFACGTGGFLASALNYLKPQRKTPADADLYDKSIYGMEKKSLPYILCAINMLLHDVQMPEIIHANTLERSYKDYYYAEQFGVILMNPPYGGNERDIVKKNFPADLSNSETSDLFLSVVMFRLKRNGRCGIVLPDGFLFGTDATKVSIKKKLLKEFNLHTIIRLPAGVFAPYTSITTNVLFFDKTMPTEQIWFYRVDPPAGLKSFSKNRPLTNEHMKPVLAWLDNKEEIIVDDMPKAKCYSIQEIVDLGYNLDLCGFTQSEDVILSPLELLNQYTAKKATLDAAVDCLCKEVATIFGNQGGAKDDCYSVT